MSLRYSLLLIAAAICSAASRSYVDPHSSPIHRVCIMPPNAQVMRVGVKGGESLAAESETWAVKLAEALRHAITQAGAEVNGDLSTQALINRDQERQSVIRLRQKYENVALQLQRKQRDVKKGRFTLTDEIALLPCAAQADSVAFMDATGTIQTGGRKTLSVITGGLLGPLLAMSHYEIRIAFADTKTGEISSLVRIDSIGGKAAKDPDVALKTSLAAEFKNIRIGPAAAPAPTASPN